MALNITQFSDISSTQRGSLMCSETPSSHSPTSRHGSATHATNWGSLMLANNFGSLTCIIPADMRETGNAIMRSLDNDTGGHLTFGEPNLLKDGAGYIGVNVPYCNALVPVAAWWLFEPAELQAYIEADYKLRWPDLTPPAAEDVTAFAEAVIAVSDEPLEVVAERFGFAFKGVQQ